MSRRVIFTFLLGVVLSWPATGGEATGWRTDGTGRYPEAQPPTTWSAEKNVIWKTPLANWGNATPVLAGKYLFVSSENGTTLVLEPGRQYKELARNKLKPFRATPVFPAAACISAG